MEVCAVDLTMAFFYGITREIVFICVGSEFRKNIGKIYLIDKCLYGEQSSSARFYEKLTSSLR